MRVLNQMLLFALIFNCSCMGNDIKMSDTQLPNKVTVFLNSKNYTMSKNKEDMPDVVISYLSEINGKEFKIGDSTDLDNINFSDVSLGKIGNEYKRKLNLVLFNDVNCIMVYREGGLGTHEVVDFFQYEKDVVHIRYTTTKSLNDITSLREFLKHNPPYIQIKPPPNSSFRP